MLNTEKTLPAQNMPVTQKRRGLKGRTREKIFIACMLAYPLIQFFIFWFIVNINSIFMTFQKLDLWGTGEYIFTGFSNYEQVFRELATSESLQRTLTNSLLYMPVTCFISLPLSILFSYFLFKKVPLSPVFRVIFFLPSIMPVVVLTMAFAFSFDSTFGPIDKIVRSIFGSTPSWFGDDPTAQIMIFVYCIWAGLGFNIILLSGAIGRVPQEVMEYSKLEGVGMARELFTLVVPLVWPTITTTFILGCTSVFTVMLQPLLLTPNNPNTQTIALMIYNGVLRDRDLPYLTALGLTLSLIGAPIIMLIRWGLGKIYADVEY